MKTYTIVILLYLTVYGQETVDKAAFDFKQLASLWIILYFSKYTQKN